MLAGILKDIVNFTVELSLILYCSRIMISILYMHIYIYIGIVMIYVVRKITARLQMKKTLITALVNHSKGAQSFNLWQNYYNSTHIIFISNSDLINFNGGKYEKKYFL